MVMAMCLTQMEHSQSHCCNCIDRQLEVLELKASCIDRVPGASTMVHFCTAVGLSW